MWKCLALGCTLVVTAFAQTTSAQLELANLREDVRGLTQRVGDLTLRLEQLERENSELRAREAKSAKTFATLAQLNEAVGDLNQNIRTAVAASKSETLQSVEQQVKELAKRTNTALESLAKAPSPVAAAPFADDFPKEGISYEVQKGDTLAVIARKTGAKQQDIINANKLADPSRIVVGQKLFIPGGK
jgi:LysM repeat protein